MRFCVHLGSWLLWNAAKQYPEFPRAYLAYRTEHTLYTKKYSGVSGRYIRTADRYTNFLSLVGTMPFVFSAVQTSTSQRLEGLPFASFFFWLHPKKTPSDFYLASPHVRIMPSKGKPCIWYVYDITHTWYNEKDKTTRFNWYPATPAHVPSHHYETHPRKVQYACII